MTVMVPTKYLHEEGDEKPKSIVGVCWYPLFIPLTVDQVQSNDAVVFSMPATGILVAPSRPPQLYQSDGLRNGP